MKTQRRFFNYIITLIISLILLHSNAFGVPIDWKGGTSSDWNLPANWSPAHVPLSTEDVRIGVGSATFTNQPTVTTSTIILSLTIGTNKGVVLTVNGGITLTVNGSITQMHTSNNAPIATNILGLGTITCTGSFNVGDGTNPPVPVLGLVNANITNQTVVNLTLSNLNIGQNLVVKSTSSTANLLGIITSNVNNPTLNILNGTVVVGANVQMTNAAYINRPALTILIIDYPAVKNSTQLLLNPASNTTTGTNATLSFGGILDINGDASASALLDLYGPGAGTSTAVYSGNSGQTLYYSTTGLDNSPYVYQNIGFSGTGIKTIPTGTLNIPGNWSSAGGKVDVSTANVVFLGGAQTLSDAGSDAGKGVMFNTVTFGGTNTKTLSSKFSVANTGVLTMAGAATLAANGNLTLISDATSSASVAAIPSGTFITGNVNVQRFFKGSSTDLSKRGYRLISSAVYAGSPSGIRSFDLKYLLNDAYVSGMAGGGFNAPTGNNPTLFLYREDIVPNNKLPTSGNFKGVSQIDNGNTYDIGTQTRTTITNIADTITNIPIGNGLLFFFRGNKTGNKVTAPFDYPEDVTFTQTGILNTGTVNVKEWYAPVNNYTLSYTNNTLNNATARGFTLVGNPYPSTINWEKFNRNGANSSIYGSGFPAPTALPSAPSKIWMLNPTTKQYDTYLQSTNALIDTTNAINPSGSIQTGDASNMIASGQGFFIRTTTTGQALTFRESAKTNTQPVAANLIRLMSTPGSVALQTAAQVTPVQPMPMLKFRMIKDDINTDDVVLAFNKKTGTKFNDTTDVEDLNGNGALVSLSIVSSDNISTAIKQLQLPQKNQQVIALLADATASGLYQLKLDNIKDLPATYEVWLMDAFTKDSLDIKNHNTYNFNIYKNNAATYGSKRFKIIVRQNTALGMHALGFDAVKTTKGSKLTWVTENELDDYAFNVQRSVDNGKTFEDLQRIQSSGIGSYVYWDSNPIKGQNQYKVRIENLKDASTSYTNTVNIIYADTVDNSTNIMVYPNPAASTVTIKMPESITNNALYTIKILNASGMLMKQVTTAQPAWKENIDTLLPGTYIVQIINNRNSKVEGRTKFVKVTN